VDLQRQSRIRPPRHRWSHEVWEATAAKDLEQETTSVIVKTCNWGNLNSPFVHLRRMSLRRESSALQWMEMHAPQIAPRQLSFDQDQIVLERFTGPDFFSDQKSLTNNHQVWERLSETVKRMHEGGLAHGELRLGNVVFHNEEVRLVDFATAFTRESSLYKPLRWLDRMAIVWMKAHIFRLPLDSEELSLQDDHKVFHQWFLKYIACDIPYA
jgi:hypothetical protein